MALAEDILFRRKPKRRTASDILFRKVTPEIAEPTIPQVGISPTEQIELDEFAREQEAMPFLQRPEDRRLDVTPPKIAPIGLIEPEPLDIGLEWTPPPKEVVLRAPIPADITPPELKPLEDAINEQVRAAALQVDTLIEREGIKPLKRQQVFKAITHLPTFMTFAGAGKVGTAVLFEKLGVKMTPYIATSVNNAIAWATAEGILSWGHDKEPDEILLNMATAGISGAVFSPAFKFIQPKIAKFIRPFLKPEVVNKAFKTVRVKKGASQSAIYKAYKKRALKIHPDRPGGDVKKMQELVDAFETLKKNRGYVKVNSFLDKFRGWMKKKGIKPNEVVRDKVKLENALIEFTGRQMPVPPIRAVTPTPTATEIIRTEARLIEKAGLDAKTKISPNIAEPLIRGDITEAEAISRIKADVARIEPVEPLKEVVELEVKPAVLKTIKVDIAGKDENILVESLEIYKGREIVDIDGLINVYNPQEKTLFEVGLDDTKLTGDRIRVEEANNIETARKYIDWVTKAKKDVTYKKDIVDITPVKPIEEVKPIAKELKELSEKIKQVGGNVSPEGKVTVYHRTEPAELKLIKEFGKIEGVNHIYFSVLPKGRAVVHGESVIKLDIPMKELEVEEIFPDEVYLRYPLTDKTPDIDIKKYEPAKLPIEKKVAPIKKVEKITPPVEVKPPEKVVPEKVIRVFEPKKLKPGEVKPFIRRITGQVTLSKLIREDVALKKRLLKEQIAARRAFVLGRKKGEALHKQRIKEIEERMKERKEQRERIKSMVTKMEAVDTSKMSPQEAEPIKSLLKDLDLVKRQKPTMLKLSKTRDFLNTNPDAEMPDYMLDRLARLDKKNLNNITIDELETVFHSVMHYTHLNKLKNKIKVGREMRRADQVLTDSINEMKPPKKIKDDIVRSQKSKLGRLKKTGVLLKDTFGIRHDHYDLIIESLAGANSTMDKILYTDVKEGIITQLKRKQDVFRDFQKDVDLENFQKKYKIKDIADWQNERVQVGKFNLTKGERMSLYRHSLNADNIKAILEGGFGFKDSPTPNRVYRMNKEELDNILNDLTPAEKEFSGNPIQNLFDSQYEAMSKVFSEKNGYPMPKEVNYYPKNTMPMARGIDIEKETALERFKGKWTRVGLEKGMLEKRLRVQLPLYLNNIAYDVNRSVLNASAYIGLELPLSNASKLLYNNEFRAELVNRYGKQTWQEIEKGLRDIAGDHQSYSTVEELALKLKNKLSTAILGFNPFVMAKQILSFPLYSVYVKPQYLMQGFMDFIVHPKELSKRHKLYSPEYTERVEGGYSRDVADVFKTRAERRIYKGRKSIPEKLMGGIKIFDLGAVVPGMQGAVLQVLDEFRIGKLSSEVKKALDITEADIAKLNPGDKMKLAYKFADYVTERTQPMFSPEHRSSLSRGSSIEQLFTQFTSFTNQALNLIRRTWRSAADENDPQTYAKLLKVLFLLLVVNTGGIMVIDDLRNRLFKRKKREEKGIAGRFGSAVLDSVASYFYFLRELNRSVSSKIERGTFVGHDISIPVLGAANTFAGALSNGIASLTEEDPAKRNKRFKRFIDESVEMLLLTQGIPYRTPKKIVKRVLGIEPIKVKISRLKTELKEAPIAKKGEIRRKLFKLLQEQRKQKRLERRQKLR